MRDIVPLRDEGEDFLLQLRDIREVGSGEPLPLQDGEPLFDLVHPGAVHGREVHLEARMLLEPGANLLAVMNADVVADDVDELDLRRRFLVDLLQEFDELDLSLSPTTDSEDLSGPGVERSKEIERTLALVFVLDTHGYEARLRWTCRRCSRAWLH